MEQIISFGRSLQQFEVQLGNQIFKDAENLPQFFYSNLQDDARVIKQFKNDPQANLRIFYYQYLKLCFEFDNPNYQSYIDKIQQFITNPQFYFLFPQGDDPEIFNDKQFKRLIIEFFEFMNQGGISVNKAINKFPIIDIVLVYFFRTFLILAQKTDSFDNYIDRQILFDLLTSYFNVQASVHQNCMKFIQTDIFAYQESPQQVFMVYIDYEHSIPSNSYNQPLSSKFTVQEVYIQNIQPKNIEIQSSKSSYKIAQNQLIQENKQVQQIQPKKQILTKKQMPISYMGNSQIYDFVDYTNPKNKQIQITLGQNKPVSTVVEEDSQYQFTHPLIQNKTEISTLKNNYQQQQFNTYNNSPYTGNLNINNYFNQTPSLSLSSKSNFIQSSVSKSKTNLYNCFQINKGNILGSNQKINNHINLTVDYKPEIIKHHHKNLNTREEMTNSFTLEKVSEPHKTNIKAMKARSRANRKGVGGYLN